MTLEELIKRQNEEKWSLWDDIKLWWEYNVIHRWWDFKNGIQNLWKYRKVIWKDRWYDWSFIDDLLKFKLNDMKEHWHKDTHYCFDWNERLLLERLVEILEQIETLEETSDGELLEWQMRDQKIKELYQEFGELLYKIREFETYDCEGKVDAKYKTNGIQKLWD